MTVRGRVQVSLARRSARVRRRVRTRAHAPARLLSTRAPAAPWHGSAAFTRGSTSSMMTRLRSCSRSRDRTLRRGSRRRAPRRGAARSRTHRPPSTPCGQRGVPRAGAGTRARRGTAVAPAAAAVTAPLPTLQTFRASRLILLELRTPAHTSPCRLPVRVRRSSHLCRPPPLSTARSAVAGGARRRRRRRRLTSSRRPRRAPAAATRGRC